MLSIIRFELKQTVKMLMIWLLALFSFSFILILMYPQIEEQMLSMRGMFQEMSGFSQALNIDDSQFESLFGFYSMELENSIAIALAGLAASIGGRILSREENQRTGEFLYSQPLSRTRSYLGKFLAGVLQLTLFNLLIFIGAILIAALLGQTMPLNLLFQFHFALYLMQGCFFILAIGSSGIHPKLSAGFAVAIAILCFCFQIMANLWDKLEGLKWITPFSFIKASTLLNDQSLDYQLIASNLLLALIICFIGFLYYRRRDLHL